MNVLAWHRLKRDDLPVHDAGAGAFAVVAGRHAEKLAEGDFSFPWIIEREGFGEIFFGKYFCIQAVGDFAAKFLEHDTAGNAGVSLASGSHVRVGIAMGAAEIFLEDEIPVAHDE